MPILTSIPDIQYIQRGDIVFQYDRNNPCNRFDPITMGILTAVGGGSAATGALIVGAGITAAGQIQQGRVAKAQGKATEKIQRYNAELAEREGKARMEASKLEERRVARQEKMFRGEQRARFAKAGISISEGTPIDVLADTAAQFAIDRNLTLRQGLTGQQQAKGQTAIFSAQGQQAKAIGRANQRLSYFNVAGTTLMAAGAIDSAPGNGGTSLKPDVSQANKLNQGVGYGGTGYRSNTTSFRGSMYT